MSDYYKYSTLGLAQCALSTKKLLRVVFITTLNIIKTSERNYFLKNWLYDLTRQNQISYLIVTYLKKIILINSFVFYRCSLGYLNEFVKRNNI